MPTPNHLARHSAAIALVLVSFVITYALWPIMQPSTFSIMFMATMLSGWLYGRRAGVTATIVSVLLIDYYFVEPRGHFTFDLHGLVMLIVFTSCALAAGWAGASRRRALFRAEQESSHLRKLQEKMAATEARWRTLVESSPNMVWTSTPDGACDYTSRQFSKYAGMEQSSAMGFKWLTLLHPDDRDRVCDVWERAIAAGQQFDTELRLRSQSGEYRWFKTRALPVLDDQGNVTKWVGSSTDIDDLRETLERLHLPGSVRN